MPPKVQFTRTRILQTAIDLIQREGMDSLTMRKLAAELGCSVAPIYVNFRNTEELQQALMEHIKTISWEYSTRSYTDMGFFNIGIGQLLFALDHSRLFMDLLIRESQSFRMDEETRERMVDIMMEDPILQGLERSQCTRLLEQMALFTSGLSLGIAKKSLDLTVEQAIALMEETAYQLVYAMKAGFKPTNPVPHKLH